MADYQSSAHRYPPSGDRLPHTDSTSQVTACLRCRKQKLRCSRERPSCKRCQDISSGCTYPPPPDRKLLAAQRAQNAKARSLPESGIQGEQLDSAAGESGAVSGEALPRVQDSTQSVKASTSDVGCRSSTGISMSPAQVSSVLLQVSFPSRELALALIDAYFDHLYNASLLFHEQILISEYLAGKIPDYVALSVFALGAIYITETKGPNIEFSPKLHGSSRPGEDWARAASQKALMNCDQPRYEVVQACQTLALYWWAFNHTDRTYMHNNIAYRTCLLLGYHSPLEGDPKDDPFNLELKRRAFWCAWCMCCFTQNNNASFKEESWKEAVGLPLPCDETSFLACQPVVRETFDSEGRLESLGDGPREIGRTSYFAEIVKLLSLWCEIQRFAKRYVNVATIDSLKRLSQLQELDQQLELVYDNLDLDFQYVGQSSFVNREAAHSYQIFSVHAFYHLCVCTLHSSIVPLFSNFPPDPRISKKLTRMSATEAVKHSQQLLNMATELLGIHPDKSRCPSFSAYAMYVAASIQFKSLGAQGLLRSDSVGRMYPAISILERVKKIWRPLENLWARLDTLFTAAGMEIDKLSDTRSLYAQPGSSVNIDRIVAHGVMMGSTDIYTYVPDEVYNEQSSGHSSASLSRRESDNRPDSSQRKPTPAKLKPKPTIPQGPACIAPVYIPIHPPQDAPQQQWTGLPSQHHEINHVGYMPPGFRPMNPMPENVQGGRLSSQFQIAGPGPADLGMSLGNDLMDLDLLASNLWWDKPFDAVPVEQYGVLEPLFQVIDGGAYYKS